jgi:hypothetical protein
MIGEKFDGMEGGERFEKHAIGRYRNREKDITGRCFVPFQPINISDSALLYNTQSLFVLAGTVNIYFTISTETIFPKFKADISFIA